MRDPATNPIHALSLARRHEDHVVTSVLGDDDLTCRLHEMGFGEGAAVSLERAGNPAIVRVGASRVAMSSDLMERVSVRCIH